MLNIPADRLQEHPTPYYCYDMTLLDRTLGALAAVEARYPAFRIHYALKANVNPVLLERIAGRGFGADIVSGGELRAALQAGFRPGSVFFAGVGKTDAEIEAALDAGIGCFNVESEPELEVIAAIARRKGLVADIALRVNPNIDAHTHHFITTGLEDNKFGINLDRLDACIDLARGLEGVNLRGLHFHIGSQITIMYPFRLLCERVNDIVKRQAARGVEFSFVNLGGGLGVDYDDPDGGAVPDFGRYADVIAAGLDLPGGMKVHLEPGRSVVAQCGSLISRVLYIKEGHSRRFAIIDAGMSELIRPALYGALHRIDNLSAAGRGESRHLTYDVVGPVCETSDTFGEGVVLPVTRRGDILAVRSAGAYGESMASHYNCRSLNQPLYINRT